MTKRTTVHLTTCELSEILNCLEAAFDQHLAYGHICGGAEQLAINYRGRLIDRFRHIYDDR